MTDPVLSDVVSPVPLGPKRMHAPPIPLEDLSGIDAVLISHDHYDHLDMKTIQHLAAQGTQFYVGLGVGAHLERWKVAPAQIHEMDWWESLKLKNVRIQLHAGTALLRTQVAGQLDAVGVMGREGCAALLLLQRRHRLCRPLSRHTRAFGDTDLNLIKVGAYGTPPSWLDIHMDPESAVRANQDLGGGILLPVHWATFNLSYHAWDEPILRTLRAAAEQHVQVVTPRVGEVVVVGQPFSNVEWYKPAR